MLRLFLNGRILLIVHYLFMAPTHTFVYAAKGEIFAVGVYKETARANMSYLEQIMKHLAMYAHRYNLCGASPPQIFEASSAINN